MRELDGAAARLVPSSLYQCDRASVPISVLQYNGPLLFGFNMLIKGLNTDKDNFRNLSQGARSDACRLTLWTAKIIIVPHQII